MTDRWRGRLTATLALLAVLAAPAASTQQLTEHARLEVLLLRPAVPGEVPHPSAAPGIAAPLHIPGGWSVLDAAAILIDDPAWPAAARYRCVSAWKKGSVADSVLSH